MQRALINAPSSNFNPGQLLDGKQQRNMEPIGLCGGGLVALILFLVAAVGSAALAGVVALALAKLGVTVDARLSAAARRQPHRKAQPERPAPPASPPDA